MQIMGVLKYQLLYFLLIFKGIWLVLEVSKVRKSMVDIVTIHGFCNASAYNINNLFING